VPGSGTLSTHPWVIRTEAAAAGAADGDEGSDTTGMTTASVDNERE
jgi:hypothetical protein